jgi:hypothetical protein
MKHPTTALVLLAIESCCPTTPPSSTIVVTSCPGDDSGVFDEAFEADQSPEALGLSSTCARACSNLSRLGCPESRKPAGGRTCVQTCKAIEGVSSYSPACVAASADVAAVRKCPAVRCLRP